MTDPDERTINRAIAYVPNGEEGYDGQDIREAARAALHRLFRDRRRLERLVANVDQTPEYLNLLAERDRLRETLDAGLMYGENGVYWHARCQAAHLREAEKDKELARLREELAVEKTFVCDDVRRRLENIAYHPIAEQDGLRDWKWEATSMRNIALGLEP